MLSRFHCIFTLITVFLAILSSCTIETNTYSIAFSIDRAYISGKYLELTVTYDPPLDPKAYAYQACANLPKALTINGGSFSIVGWGNHSFIALELNKAVSPSDPSNLSLHVDRTVNLGSLYTQGGYGPNYVPNTNMVFSFLPNQQADIPIVSPVFLLVTSENPHIQVNVGAYNGTEKPFVLDGSHSRFTTSTLGKLVAIPYNAVENNYSASGSVENRLVCIPAFDFTSPGIPAEIYFTSAGSISQLPVPFDGQTVLNPGCMVTVGNSYFPGAEDDN